MVERFAALVDMADALELGADGPIADSLLVQPSGQGDGLWALLGV
jgi:hypothetical protein